MAEERVYDGVHGDTVSRTYTTSDCVINIVSSVYWGHMRQDFMDWLSREIDTHHLTIEQGVLVATGALDWLMRI